MPESVHIFRERLYFSWGRRASDVKKYQIQLTNGVRDFTTFIPVNDLVILIFEEFRRSERFWEFRPLRRKYLRKLISELEIAMGTDTYWLDIPHSGEDNISGAARLNLTLARTKKFLSNQYDDLPIHLGEWI